METQIERVRTELPGTVADCATMVQAAIDKNVSGDAIKAAFEVWRDMQRFAAEAAYAAAMTAFQRDCPPMPRGQQGAYTRTNRAGIKVKGRYTDLADIGATISPILSQHGLSWDWDDTRLEDHGGVPCYRAHLRIRHEQGHSEVKAGPPVPLGAPVTRAADGVAAQSAQAHASSVITTAQRLCLRSAFGLWSIDPDEEDAASAAASLAPLDDEHVATIQRMLHEYATVTGTDGSEMRKRMLKAATGDEATPLASIPPDKYDWIVARLREHAEKARAAK